MREKFWKKLEDNDRNFMWFYKHYIKDKIIVDVAYNTLYQQAKGEILKSMDDGLDVAIKKYLEEK